MHRELAYSNYAVIVSENRLEIHTGGAKIYAHRVDHGNKNCMEMIILNSKTFYTHFKRCQSLQSQKCFGTLRILERADALMCPARPNVIIINRAMNY